MVLNENGFPLIAYYDDSFSDLELAVCNNAACESPTLATIDSVGNVGSWTCWFQISCS